MATASVLIRTTILVLAASALSLAQQAERTKLYPTSAKPTQSSTTLTSTEQRVGNVVFQVFSLRSTPQREAFRVNVGSYEGSQLVKDWTYGIILEEELNGDGIPDYVWYGGDDTGQRLLLFLSKDHHYECVNVFKSAEAVWKKKLGKTAPDLGEVGGDEMANNVTWNRLTHSLIVSVVPNDLEKLMTEKWKLEVAPNEFVHGEQ